VVVWVFGRIYGKGGGCFHQGIRYNRTSTVDTTD
jgi:hypothetical protein